MPQGKRGLVLPVVFPKMGLGWSADFDLGCSNGSSSELQAYWRGSPNVEVETGEATLFSFLKC